MKYLKCMKCGHSFIENIHQCPTCGAIDFIVVDREDPIERTFFFLLKKWFRRAYGFSLLVVCLLCLILYTHFNPLVYNCLSFRCSKQGFMSILIMFFYLSFIGRLSKWLVLDNKVVRILFVIGVYALLRIYINSDFFINGLTHTFTHKTSAFDYRNYLLYVEFINSVCNTFFIFSLIAEAFPNTIRADLLLTDSLNNLPKIVNIFLLVIYVLLNVVFFLLLRNAYPSDISFLDYFGTIIIVFAFLFFQYYVEKRNGE